MKKIVLITLALALGLCGSTFAQARGFGLGVILGEPTGINFKAWTGYKTAFVGAAAWSFGHEDSLHVHLDYIVHNFRLLKLENGHLPVYYGIGVRIKTGNDVRFGVRVPLGINYMFEKAPLDIFVEIAPIFDLTPKTDLFFNGGIGIRYYF
jgi:hypothetical protein